MEVQGWHSSLSCHQAGKLPTAYLMGLMVEIMKASLIISSQHPHYSVRINLLYKFTKAWRQYISSIIQCSLECMDSILGEGSTTAYNFLVRTDCGGVERRGRGYKDDIRPPTQLYERKKKSSYFSNQFFLSKLNSQANNFRLPNL